jgi:hypothetical protein
MENIEQQAIPSKNEQSYQNQSKNLPNNFQNQNIINQSQQILFKKQNERVKTKVINLIYNFQLLILFNIRMWQALKVIILKIIN